MYVFIYSEILFRDFLKIVLCSSFIGDMGGAVFKVVQCMIFATFRDCTSLVINMVNFKKYLRESKDMKFDAIASKKESEPNPYSCNYSPVSHHKYCEHEHCIFDDEWIREEVAKTELRNKINEEEDYLKHGEGTVGYDRLSVYKNVLKLKKQLRNLLGER